MSRRTLQIETSIHRKVRLLSADKDIRIGDLAGKLILLGLSVYENKAEKVNLGLDLPGKPVQSIASNETKPIGDNGVNV